MSIGLWQLYFWLLGHEGWPKTVVIGLPVVSAIVGLWATYRSVNLPAFADFLIAVEAEMNKVSWPSWSELVAVVDGGYHYDFRDRLPAVRF